MLKLDLTVSWEGNGWWWHCFSFLSICLFMLHQRRRRKTLPCLPITWESLWPSTCAQVCLEGVACEHLWMFFPLTPPCRQSAGGAPHRPEFRRPWNHPVRGCAAHIWLQQPAGVQPPGLPLGVSWGETESNRLTLPLSSQSNGLRLGRRRQPCRWCLEAGATLTPFVSRKYYTRAQATSCQSQIQLHCITRMTYFLIFPLFIIRLRAETSEKQLEELARRARKLQGERLAPKDFAQFLNLPVTDTLTHTHRLFDQVNTHAGRG